MNDDLVQKIQAVLEQREYPRHVTIVTQETEISAAINAIVSETGTNRKEIIWRAVRVYLYSYLHTHKEGRLEPDDSTN